MTNIICVSLPTMFRSISSRISVGVMSATGHAQVAVGIRVWPLIGVSLVEINLGWRSRSGGIIQSTGTPRGATCKMRCIRFIRRLTVGSKVVTILILVTLTPFMNCPIDGTVIVISKSFSLLFFAIGCIRRLRTST